MARSRQDDEFSREQMEDFFLDFRDAHQTCENTLIDLEQDPTNAELLNALFRSVHTIKGNLVYVGLKDLTPLIQSVEDVLDAVRKHSLAYDASLSDVIMLAMDKTKQMVEARLGEQSLPLEDAGLDHLCQQISRIAEVSLGGTQAFAGGCHATDGTGHTPGRNWIHRASPGDPASAVCTT